MENEVRDIIQIAVNLILVSIIIGFIVFCANMVQSMGAVRNNEISSNNRVVQYREFNGYDQKPLIGDEVTELIRLKYDSGVTIFVDYRENKSTHDVVDAMHNNSCMYCVGNDGDHRKFNLDQFIRHKESGPDFNYFNVGTNNISAERNDMRNWFPTESFYMSFLVYNSQDTTEFYKNLVDYYDANIDADMSDDEKLDILYTGVPTKIIGSEVTGVVLISYHTLGITPTR